MTQHYEGKVSNVLKKLLDHAASMQLRASVLLEELQLPTET